MLHFQQPENMTEFGKFRVCYHQSSVGYSFKNNETSDPAYMGFAHYAEGIGVHVDYDQPLNLERATKLLKDRKLIYEGAKVVQIKVPPSEDGETKNAQGGYFLRVVGPTIGKQL